MKRNLLWAVSTTSVVAILFGYHTSTAGATASTASSTPATSSPTSSSPTTSSPTSSSPTSSSPTSSSPTSSSSGASSSFTGDSVNTRWGPVQVKITVKSGKITAVDVVQYPNENPRDAEINQVAVPTLVSETLKAQSAKVDMVSGATYTSTGYLQSLQSALDQAGL